MDFCIYRYTVSFFNMAFKKYREVESFVNLVKVYATLVYATTNLVCYSLWIGGTKNFSFSFLVKNCLSVKCFGWVFLLLLFWLVCLWGF